VVYTMPRSFPLILPSNSSFPFYPTNMASSFKTKLPQRIVFGPDENWEVAVKEIMYPRTWYNLKDCDLWFWVAEDRQSTDPIPSSTVDEVIYHTEKKLFRLTKAKTSGNKPIVISACSVENCDKLVALFNDRLSKSQHTSCKLDLNKQSSKISIKVVTTATQKILPAFNSDILQMFGLESFLPATDKLNNGTSLELLTKAFDMNWLKPDAPVDLNAGYHMLILNSDIVEHTIVGDCYANILQYIEVPTHSAFGDMCVVRNSNPQYRKVRKTDFDTIELDITDSTGSILPLQYGTSIVSLDFRLSYE
jgi:hypothetical protein